MTKNLKLLLFLSAAVNILLIGGVCGYLAGQLRSAKPPQQAPQQANMQPMKEDQFRQMLEGVRSDTQPLNERIEKAREEVFTSLTAKEFDARVYMEKVQALHQLHGERVTALAKAVEKTAMTLTQQEREALAQRLRRMPGEQGPRERGGPPEHGRPDHRPPPPHEFGPPDSEPPPRGGPPPE